MMAEVIDKSFKPTREWMAIKYEELNKQLFGGALGSCDFEVFTSGRGSEGRTLGWFKLSNRQVMAERYSRRMFINANYGEKIYIDKENFETYCWPKIGLNGNYSGTEHAFMATLVHEMCHYYTYMNGYCPKQGHGPEFKNIAYYVSDRSEGVFSIQRLASAEDMKEFELSDEMKAKKQARVANKKSSITVVFRYKKNGAVEMTNTNSAKLIELILASRLKPEVSKVVISKDPNLIELLYSKGYRSTMRTWKYWNVAGKDFVNNLDQYDKTEFLNTSTMESRKTHKDIIKEVIDEYLDDGIEVGGINLGLHSPFEYE